MPRPPNIDWTAGATLLRDVAAFQSLKLSGNYSFVLQRTDFLRFGQHNVYYWYNRMEARMQEEGVLRCWKEIAVYLGCGVRTAQRWERTLGLPIHRPCGGDYRIVAAFVDELRKWRAGWARTAGRAELVKVSRESLANDLLKVQVAIQQRITTGSAAPIVIQFDEQWTESSFVEAVSHHAIGTERGLYSSPNTATHRGAMGKRTAGGRVHAPAA